MVQSVHCELRCDVSRTAILTFPVDGANCFYPIKPLAVATLDFYHPHCAAVCSMRTILSRLPYVGALWAGAGFGSWLFGMRGGEVACLLGAVSGADLYWSLKDPRRRIWLMFVLTMLGLPFGLTYEYLLSVPIPWPMRVKAVVFGYLMGYLFSLVSSGIWYLFGVRGSPDTGGSSGMSSGGAHMPS